MIIKTLNKNLASVYILTLTPAKVVVRLQNQLFANGLLLKCATASAMTQDNDAQFSETVFIPEYNWTLFDMLSCKVLNWVKNRSSTLVVYFLEDASIVACVEVDGLPVVRVLPDRWLAKYGREPEYLSTSRGVCIQKDLIYFLILGRMF